MANTDFFRQRIDTRSLPPALIAKWGAPALSEGFVPFPKRLLRCMQKVFTGDLGLRELTVVLAVADFKRPNLTRNPSAQFLGFIAGMEPAEVIEALRRLESKELVQVADFGAAELDINLEGLLKRIDKETLFEQNSPF